MNYIIATSTFYSPIYLGMSVILLILFFFTRNWKIETLIGVALILLFVFALLDYTAHGEDVRDANGKLITRSVQDGRHETVRDAGTGRIIENRQTNNGTTTVRDGNGKIIRTEKKK